jgi:3-methyladenine DNA glycosylase AlkC
MQRIRSLAVNNKIIKSRVNLSLSPFLKDTHIKKLSNNVNIIEKRGPEYIKNKFDSYYKETKEQEIKEK